MLKLLCRIDGASGLPLSQPDLPVQPHPTCQYVDVVLVRVLMAHGHPRRISLVKTHALHEVSHYGLPLLAAQSLAGR